MVLLYHIVCLLTSRGWWGVYLTKERKRGIRGIFFVDNENALPPLLSESSPWGRVFVAMISQTQGLFIDYDEAAKQSFLNRVWARTQKDRAYWEKMCALNNKKFLILAQLVLKAYEKNTR